MDFVRKVVNACPFKIGDCIYHQDRFKTVTDIIISYSYKRDHSWFKIELDNESIHELKEFADYNSCGEVEKNFAEILKENDINNLDDLKKFVNDNEN